MLKARVDNTVQAAALIFIECKFWVEWSNMVQLNQHLKHYDLLCGATIVARVHSLWHLDNRDTILRYSLNLDHHPLRRTDFVKYIGLTITSDLKFITPIIGYILQRKLTASLNLLHWNLKKIARILISHWFGPTWNMPPRFGAHIHLMTLKSGDGADTCCKVRVQLLTQYQQC